jgi:hypothetical protein
MWNVGKVVVCMRSVLGPLDFQCGKYQSEMWERRVGTHPLVLHPYRYARHDTRRHDTIQNKEDVKYIDSHSIPIARFIHTFQTHHALAQTSPCAPFSTRPKPQVSTSELTEQKQEKRLLA